MSMNGHPLSSHINDYLLLCTYWRTTAQSTLGRGAMLLYRSSLEWDSEININPAELIMWAAGKGEVDGNEAFSSNQERSSCLF